MGEPVLANPFESVELRPGSTLYKSAGDQLHSPDVIAQEPGCDVVLLGLPYGECGGVRMANAVIGELGKTSLGPIHGNHEPTHGADATAAFERLGARFDVSPEDVPPGGVFVISAHGAAPDIRRRAGQLGLDLYDVTCPLVTRTHLAIERASRDEQGVVAYISFGNPNHPELVGAAGVAEEFEIPFRVVQDHAEAAMVVDGLSGDETITVVGQTTNNSDAADRLAHFISRRAETRGITVSRPESHDVCHTVRDRQDSTRRIIEAGVGSLVVVGSVNSKNTKSLAEVGAEQAEQLKRALDIYLVNSWGQLPVLSGRVGVISGASTLAANVEGVLQRLAPVDGVNLVGVDTDKAIVFKPKDPKTRTFMTEGQ